MDKARVVVISRELNDKLFQGQDSVGRTLTLFDGRSLRVVGVVQHWRPVPRFYDLYHARFAAAEQVYVPFSTSRDLDLPPDGKMYMFGSAGPHVKPTDLDAHTVWIQFWVELDSRKKAAAYAAYLRNYSDAQRAAGRYERPTNVRLRSLMGWLSYKQVVPSDFRLDTWLAFGFLLVCLVNTVGLLLARFLRRAPEVGVRRALGASRRAVFAQFLVEAGVIGFAAASGASLLAALLPAWRACQIPPALQLKSR